VAVVDDKLYVVGGMDSTHTKLSSMVCLDPLTGEWDVVAPMSTARCNHGVAVVDGKIYVVGGWDATSTKLGSAECFDPLTGQWSVMAAMTTARAYAAVAALECLSVVPM
jgi:N-acetylneuraminic acid mutarotase